VSLTVVLHHRLSLAFNDEYSPTPLTRSRKSRLGDEYSTATWCSG
jgi:hypothetical protein